MKTLFAILFLFVCFGMPVTADDSGPGTLIVTPIKDGKKPLEGVVGDLVQFQLEYPIVPNRIVSDLNVEIGCKGLVHLATVGVPKFSPEGKPVVGVGGIAAFVRLDKAGEHTMKITPKFANGKDGTPVEFTLKVATKP